ncbi:MAG TPA: sigma-70 family RNA polymerase sigma factor [Candidatus Limnocylindrales bacterium]|nr:sigma-70 family RNA polymerase sigma factor [Candidatus Limnocylindrales bacterium]
MTGTVTPLEDGLLERLRAGLATPGSDRADAFASLIDRSLDRSFRLASVILGSRDEAEDAVADASLRAWQHVASLHDPGRFDAWFTRIVVNVCRDRLHDRARRPNVLAVDPPAPGDDFGASIERAALHQALATLTAEHRAVVALHYLEGLTTEQIAAQLGLRDGTVKSRLHYGVRELRAAYEAAARASEGAVR